MITKAQEIDKFHRKISGRIARHAGQRMKIKVSGRFEKWKQVTKGTEVHFDMYPEKGGDFAMRQIGGGCPVFSLKPLDQLEEVVWASWREEWVSEGEGNFALISANWTFFWGNWGLYRKEQVLRAEWDHLKHAAKGAPQPHWHVDHKLLTRSFPKISSMSRKTNQASTALEEISPEPQRWLEQLGPVSCELSLSGMHLGMGGWKNDSRHPACWQCRVGERWEELTEWAERVLLSVIDQFEEMNVQDTAM